MPKGQYDRSKMKRARKAAMGVSNGSSIAALVHQRSKIDQQLKASGRG